MCCAFLWLALLCNGSLCFVLLRFASLCARVAFGPSIFSGELRGVERRFEPGGAEGGQRRLALCLCVALRPGLIEESPTLCELGVTSSARLLKKFQSADSVYLSLGSGGRLSLYPPKACLFQGGPASGPSGFDGTPVFSEPACALCRIGVSTLFFRCGLPR